MAALTLVNLGIAVIMLESGHEEPSGVLVRAMGRNFFRRVPPYDSAIRHTSTGAPDTEWIATLKPGGLSNQWTGAVPRFVPADFTEGARLHERYRWPLTYPELAPFYERVERVMAITAGEQAVPNFELGFADTRVSIPKDWGAVAEVAGRHGQGLTTIPLADGPSWMVARRGTAFNSFTNIVSGLAKSPLFKLIKGAHALQLLWSNERARVSSVIYQDRETRTQRELRGVAFVVGCGPLQSAKLLFDSACKQFPEGLGNSEGILGKFLHDHPKEWWELILDRPLSLLSPSAYLTRLPHESSEPLLATSWTLGLTSTRDKIRSRFNLSGQSVGVQVFGTMIPSEDHFVRPSRSAKDEYGLAALEINITFDQKTVANMVGARKHLVDLMAEAGFRATIQDIVPQLHPGASAHFGGTVRMHTSRQFGVLDPFNRLFDASNVMVCGASAFTTGVEKNPTLTAMALACRGAHRMAEDLRSRLNPVSQL